jgi:nitrate reductase alpha subunit
MRFFLPLADKTRWSGTLIDCNIRSERMGWLPSAPQLEENPLDLVKKAEAEKRDPVEYVVDRLSRGDLRMSCEDPDNPAQLAAQYVRLALQHSGLQRQGA